VKALSGIDLVTGVVSRTPTVNVNIAQSPQAQDFMRTVFDALRPFPEALSAVRARLLQERGKLGDVREIVQVEEIV
jgi:hypothetical protein